SCQKTNIFCSSLHPLTPFHSILITLHTFFYIERNSILNQINYFLQIPLIGKISSGFFQNNLINRLIHSFYFSSSMNQRFQLLNFLFCWIAKLKIPSTISISNFTLCLSFIFHYFLIDHLPCLFHNWKPTTIITIHKIILVFFTDKVIQCLPCIFFLQRLRTNRQRNFWIKYCSNSICNRESHQRNRFSKYLFCNEKIG